MLNSVKHFGAQKKSRIIGEVIFEGGRIWRDYCITFQVLRLSTFVFNKCSEIIIFTIIFVVKSMIRA